MEDVKIVNGENLKVVPGNGIVVITKLMRIRMKCRIVNSLLEQPAHGSSSGGCFLTTSCCDYKGLPDDCYELETMRKLRDDYISKQSYGEKLIKDYYAEAPEIVDRINSSANKDEILEKMYEKITNIVKMVDDGKKDEAIIHYMMLLHDLSKLK